MPPGQAHMQRHVRKDCKPQGAAMLESKSSRGFTPNTLADSYSCLCKSFTSRYLCFPSPAIRVLLNRARIHRTGVRVGKDLGVRACSHTRAYLLATCPPVLTHAHACKHPSQSSLQRCYKPEVLMAKASQRLCPQQQQWYRARLSLRVSA